MALRPIVTMPDPVLKRKAKPITKFDKDLQTLIDDMIETMRDAPGVGLAAPQVDISEQLIVVEYSEDDEDDDEEGVEEKPEKPKKLYVMINPEITKTSEEKVLGVADELMGRMFQHEIDHLNGVLFTEIATRLWKFQEEEEHEL